MTPELTQPIPPKRYLQLRRPGLVWVDSALGVLALALFVVTCLRAYQTTFVHDESYTYLRSVRAPLRDVLLFSGTSSSANNHLLNTLLMRISSYYFGDGEFALRLPNVLAHALYLSASVLLVRRLMSGLLAIPAFLLLNANPFMLDFFALARGYGLALGFMMPALYFGLRCSERGQVSRRFLSLSAVCGGLAVVASFSLLNFYLGLLAWLGGIGLMASLRAARGGASLPRLVIANLLPLALSTLVLASVIAVPLIKLKQSNALRMGGQSGFWEDTVSSMIQTSLYRAPYGATFVGVFHALIAAALLLNLLVICWLVSHRQVRGYGAGKMVLTIALISAASIVLQHILLGVNYPRDRAALSFVPLFGLLLICPLLWLRLTASRPARLGASTVLVVLALASTLHTVTVTSPRHPLFWRCSWDTKQMMLDLVAEHSKPGVRSRTVTPGGYWTFEPSVNYYRISWGLDWLRTYRREHPYRRGDYYFLRPQDQQILVEQSLVPVHQYPLAKTILARAQGRSASPRTPPGMASPVPVQEGTC